jgi:hypothetical protein
MSKVPLSDVNSRYGSVGALNANFDSIQQGFENTLSRDGTGPNAMEAPLDMNGNDILNISSLSVGALTINGQLVVPEGTAITTLPGQTSQAGKYLYTNGTAASWRFLEWLPTGTGAVVRTVSSKFQETVSTRDFGVVGNGVADDTVAFLNALAHCRTINAILKVEGLVRFRSISVPGESLISGYGGNYVNACSMQGAPGAQLLVEGKIGFSTTGIDSTIIENIKVVTTSRQLTESEQENTCPYVFASLSGTKTFALYRNVEIATTVSNLTGSFRAGALIQEIGVANLVVSNFKANNATRAFTAYNCADVSIRGVWFENTETGVYLSTVNNYLIDGVSLTNTQSQYARWIARTGTPARLTNGMDAVLIELGSKGQVSNIEATWPLERAAYIQSRDIQCANGKVLNGDGFKLCGTDRNNQANNVFADNLHVSLDSTFALGVGREGVAAVKTYFSNNVHVSGCTTFAHAPTQLSVIGVVNFGGFPQTINTLSIRNCHGVNAQSVAYGVMMSQTSVQLAAIDPLQTFRVANNVSIEECSLVKCQVRLFGSLLHMRDNEASTDAKATYALQNFTARRNSVVLDASGGVDDWLFDFRYLDGATTENNNVNLPFFGSFPPSVLGTAGTTYRNILMREPNLKMSVATSTLIANFANMTVLRGTALVFTGNLAETGQGDLFCAVENYVYASGLLSTGSRKIVLEGKGYFLHNAAIDCAVEMNASGLFYFGRCIGGTKTDQVGTPPITVTPAAGNLQIRGDLSPTVRYTAKITLVA